MKTFAEKKKQESNQSFFIHKKIYYSLSGLAKVIQDERGAVWTLIIGLVSSSIIWFTSMNWRLTRQTFIFTMVIIAIEILNTAIERICNYIQPEKDSRIGSIKDMSSSATFLMILTAIIVTIVDIINFISYEH